MNIPGIVKVRVLDCTALPAHLALDYAAGLPVPVAAPFSELDAYAVRLEMTRTDGRTETAELRFRLRERVLLPFAAGFLLETAKGRMYLLGTREEHPSVEQVTLTASPDDSTTDTAVIVHLTAANALLAVGAVDYTKVLLTETSSSGGSDPAAVTPLVLATPEECAAALQDLNELI